MNIRRVPRVNHDKVDYPLQGLELLLEALFVAGISYYGIYAARNNHLAHAAAVYLTIGAAFGIYRVGANIYKLVTRR